MPEALAFQVYKISQISEDDATALYCYANGFDQDGNAYFKCSTCTDDSKKRFGCGYDPAYAGKCRLKTSEDHDIKGVCPGWWRTQPWVLEVIQLRNFQQNLGHPNDFPNRFFQALGLLNMYEAEAIARLQEKTK